MKTSMMEKTEYCIIFSPNVDIMFRPRLTTDTEVTQDSNERYCHDYD